ncbi:MAG: hypothetical protein K6G00_09605 [Treponema sp.]|nr:hypothetical protein [Treponema sp.]
MIASSGTNSHLYNYAGNNPITYTDPDGRVDAYSLYNFSSEALKFEGATFATDLSIVEPSDIVPHKWAGYIVTGLVLGAIAGGSYLYIKYQESKAPAACTQPQNNEQTKESNVIRFQIQTGKETPASVVRISNDKIDVTKKDAYGTLMELYTSAVEQQPGMARCKDFTAAIVRMSEYVKKTQGEYKQGVNVWREPFEYQDKDYRIDLENLHGINLVE